RLARARRRHVRRGGRSGRRRSCPPRELLPPLAAPLLRHDVERGADEAVSAGSSAGDATIALPALATAHSHAFQRAMRGSAQRPAATSDDFWSWRSAMYRVALGLDPESIHRVSRVAFRELRRAGVLTVG